MNTTQTVTLYRPVGQQELDLIQAADWKQFPPRLYWQPIFYPVLTEEYAILIARDWNTKDPNSGHVGFVLRFEVDQDYLSQYEPQLAGGKALQEYWIPAEDLDTFNSHIRGTIDVIHEFRSTQEEAS